MQILATAGHKIDALADKARYTVDADMWLDQPVNIIQITVLNQLAFSLYNYITTVWLQYSYVVTAA